jgi:hypothetical protein
MIKLSRQLKRAVVTKGVVKDNIKRGINSLRGANIK